MTEEEIQWKEDNPTVYKKRKTDMDDAHSIIFKMLADGVNPALVYSAVQSRFPSVKPGKVMAHIKAIAKNNFQISLSKNFALSNVMPEGYSKITRFDLVRTMTKIEKEIKKEESKKPNQKYQEIIKASPEVEAIRKSYLEFHGIIMGDNPEALDDFLTAHEDSFLSGLVKGIKKDIAAVKNAISSPVSSGAVEGGNHKVKLVKRAGYGRNLLKSLLKKCFAAFRIDSVNFNIKEILELQTI
jgi:hypothetical protein